MEAKEWHKMHKRAYKTQSLLYKKLKPYRKTIVEQIARGEIDVFVGTDYHEGIRWLKRVCWHLVRISYQYEQTLLAAGK